MSTILHDAYTALLSGLTHRTGKEIHWVDKDGDTITVEPVDVERESYVVRYYYRDGSLYFEIHYLQDKLHGKCRWWHPNGQPQWEENYHQGQRHGKRISYLNSQKCWEEGYFKGQLHGKSTGWYTNGQKSWEKNHHQGQLHGKDIGWYEDGTLRYEECYINGRPVTLEEWNRCNDSTA